ncbi:hypothetical protein EIP86_002751 [Pleurotus ostreatoroseus]|nr:hypothetical protein EIP86_002751 [Pleurotus ostreatoroseus]
MDKTRQSLSFLVPRGLEQRFRLLKATAQYLLTGKGPLSSNIGEAIGFVRSDDSKLFPPSQYPAGSVPEDTTTGPNAPDLELFSTPMAYTEHTTLTPPNDGHYNFMLHTVLLRPKSSGTIRLKSADPDDLPVVDPRYLTDYNDVKTLLRGVRLVDKIAHTEPVASMIDPAGDDHPELHHALSRSSDKELERLIRERAQTLYHPACSARMAPLEDGGVVDPYLRVHGIPNLRIVDASIFPAIVSGHTVSTSWICRSGIEQSAVLQTGPVLAVAEKAADLIKTAMAKQ